MRAPARRAGGVSDKSPSHTAGPAPDRTGATQQIQEDYEPGTALNFDPLNLLKNKSEDEIYDMKSKELNNGVRTRRPAHRRSLQLLNEV